MYPSVPGTQTLLVSPKTGLHVLGASCIVASVFAEDHINIMSHQLSKPQYAHNAKKIFYRNLRKQSCMHIKYSEAPDIKRVVDTIIVELGFSHIDPERVFCFRSRGSKSRRTLARVHSLEKLWQLAIKTHPRYLIEVIAERYDELSQPDKEKVLIHELLHIPRGFSGGFRPHKGYINKKNVDKLHKIFERRKSTDPQTAKG